jgi:hypothetical protein
VTRSATRTRQGWVAASFFAAAALHVAAPAGPHSWHVLHLVAQKLYVNAIHLVSPRPSGRGQNTPAPPVQPAPPQTR